MWNPSRQIYHRYVLIQYNNLIRFAKILCGAYAKNIVYKYETKKYSAIMKNHENSNYNTGGRNEKQL